MEKLELSTPDITQENIEKIAALFPDVVTESLDDDGNLIRAIDFDALRQDLSGAIVDGPRERYQFTWPGKQAAKLEARKPCDKTMRPIRESSVNWDTTENLYIEGDNLEAVKIMRETYAGKVKLIYIDPPYNTGHDFIYDDDFAQTSAEYLAESGEFDDQGGRLVANPESNGRFHSDWCSMMYPRLLLARDLLSSDGAIFISIDGCEQKNLQAMCDEVFGRDCQIGTVVRATGQTTGQDSGGFGSSFDYLLAYSKTSDYELDGIPLNDHDLKRFENRDSRGAYAYDQMRKTGSNDRREDRPNMYYPVIDPDGNEVYPIGPTGYESCWRFERATYERLVQEDLVLWKKTKRGEETIWWPYIKYYAEGRTKRPSPLWTDLEGNKKAARDIRSLFGDKVFDFPKPVGMLERIIQIAGVKDNDIVVDFFSGSGTTAHAVMKRNAEEGLHARFIMVQLPEEIDGSYATICEIGEERIRRAGKIIADQSRESNKQLRIGEEQVPIPDIGFRVLRIGSSNFRDTFLEPGTINQSTIFDYVDNLVEGRSAEDLLFQVMPKFRIPYSSKYVTSEIAGKTVFNVNEGQLIACFDEDVDETVIEEIAKMRPLYAVFRDASMADDATAANFEELFKTYSPDTIRRII